MAVAAPVIEVHRGDPDTREAFRHVDLIADAATKRFKGHVAQGDLMALATAAGI